MNNSKVFNRLLILVILILAFNLNSCSPDEDEGAYKLVNAKLDLLIQAFENSDIELHKKIWALDDSLRVFGVYRGNNFTGWEELKNHFEKVSKKVSESKIEVLKKNINISNDGKTAWFTLLVNQYVKIKSNERELSGLRYSGVLSLISGEWRVVQFHGSVPLNVSIN